MGTSVSALLARCSTSFVGLLARIGVRRPDRQAAPANELVLAYEGVVEGREPTWLPGDEWTLLVPPKNPAPGATTRLTYPQRSRVADVAHSWGLDERELSDAASEALARFVLGETSREECRAELRNLDH